MFLPYEVLHERELYTGRPMRFRDVAQTVRAALVWWTLGIPLVLLMVWMAVLQDARSRPQGTISATARRALTDPPMPYGRQAAMLALWLLIIGAIVYAIFRAWA
jgi:hypothetical protein